VEFTIDAMASKMILLITCLSLLVIVGGVVFFHLSAASQINDAVPFGVGVIMAMALNVIKVMWLKKTINKTVDMSVPTAAGRFYQLQYFLRLVLTAVVLAIAALAPDNFVNLLGVIIGIFTFPITMRLMQFFIPPDTVTPLEPTIASSPVEEAINKIEAIASEGPEKEAE